MKCGIFAPDSRFHVPEGKVSKGLKQKDPPGFYPGKKYGKSCWRGCRKKQGKCAWCGTERYCCRYNFRDRSRGCTGKVGIPGKGHVCVSGPPSSPSATYMFGSVKETTMSFASAHLLQ